MQPKAPKRAGCPVRASHREDDRALAQARADLCGDGRYPWMMSHAQTPFAEQIDGDLYRVYFTSRDAHNRSHIGWLDVDITRPDQIVRLGETPLVAPGEKGSFDDGGTMMSCMVRHGEARYLYYIGWNRRATVPFHVSIGLAVAAEAAGISAFSAFPRPDPRTRRGRPVFLLEPLRARRGWAMAHVVLERTWLGQSRRRYLPILRCPVCPSRLMAFAGSAPAAPRSGWSWRLNLRSLGPAFCAKRMAIACGIAFARGTDRIAWGTPVPPMGSCGIEIMATRVSAPQRTATNTDMIAYPHVFDHGADRYMLSVEMVLEKQALAVPCSRNRTMLPQYPIPSRAEAHRFEQSERRRPSPGRIRVHLICARV